jgi:hypothetical protein
MMDYYSLITSLINGLKLHWKPFVGTIASMLTIIIYPDIGGITGHQYTVLPPKLTDGGISQSLYLYAGSLERNALLQVSPSVLAVSKSRFYGRHP